MADQVEEVKSKTDIVSVLGEHISLKKAGRNYKALCPFHSEKTPSFMVSPELQMFRCFGCGESGDVFAFLQKYDGMEFYEALQFLANKAGVKLVVSRPGQAGEKERLFELNRLTNRFYQYVLHEHKAGKKALAYLLEERGLKLNTIKKFELGYSPSTPGVLGRFLINRKKFRAKELVRAGLVYSRGREIVDRFRGRVVFPLFDHRGNVVGFSGRVMPGARKDTAKYINSPETPLYHKSRVLYGLNLTKREIKSKNQVVVVEGELDSISSWQAGIKNVVAIKGSSLTEDQVRLIGRFVKKVVLAPDSDFAGDAVARRGISAAQNAGLEVRVARLGDYKDPDDFARANPEGLERAIEKAPGAWDFYITSVFSKHDQKTGEGKGKISREIVPILSSIPDRIVQAHYIEKVAGLLKVPVSAVTEQVIRTKGKSDRKRLEPELIKTKDKEKSRRRLLEERFMLLAFQSDPGVLLEKEVEKLFSNRLVRRILGEYLAYSEKNKKFDTSDFSQKLPKELLDSFSEMMLFDTQGLVNNPSKLERELNLIKREIEMVDIKDKLSGLTQKMSQFEKESQEKKLNTAKKKFTELTKRLVELEEG